MSTDGDEDSITLGSNWKVVILLIYLLYHLFIFFLSQCNFLTRGSYHWYSALSSWGIHLSQAFFIVHYHLKASVDLLPELLRLRLSQLEAELQEKTERLSKELSSVTHENADLRQKIQSNG